LSSARPAAELATLTVRGESVVPVQPDELRLQLTLTEVRQAPGEAYEEVARHAAELADVLSELGVDETARSTSAVLVHEEREYDERGRPVHRGYSATSSTHVRLEDPASAGKLIQQAVTRTGARVSGPWWHVAAENPARLEACQRAASNARAKAEAYAGALGSRLGALAEVSEPDARLAPVGPRVQAFGPMSLDEPELPVEGGGLEVRAVVEVTYSVEPA
jgi:uncharacterized protein YggE